MKREVPAYIQDSFNQTVKDHLTSGALNDLKFDEIQEKSLEYLVSLEDSSDVAERDAIYQSIKSDQSLTSRTVHNIVAATDNYMHAKNMSVYGARNQQPQNDSVQTELPSLTNA